jgi:REP-associated tyrosine transposase
MPRASRHYLPGHVWHLTHRCHHQQFLLKFLKDRRIWVDWLYTACQRFGLCVLDYNVTSNHIHLIVRDRGGGEIARSMQLIAGCTGQQFNSRKHRRGAFWEDRYHATAIESGRHLARCVVYVDLNMVRAGVVAHPTQWPTCGYHEIQKPPRRFGIIDRKALAEVLEVSVGDLGDRHAEWIAEALAGGSHARIREWSSSVAVGSREFVEGIASALKSRGNGRELESFEPFEDSFVLRDPAAIYDHRFATEKRHGGRKEGHP